MPNNIIANRYIIANFFHWIVCDKYLAHRRTCSVSVLISVLFFQIFTFFNTFVKYMHVALAFSEVKSRLCRQLLRFTWMVHLVPASRTGSAMTCLFWSGVGLELLHTRPYWRTSSSWPPSRTHSRWSAKRSRLLCINSYTTRLYSTILQIYI